MKYTLIAAALAAGAISLGGCATITKGKTDPVMVTSVPIDGAKCDLKNAAGEWSVTTPGTAVVHKSNSPLEVNCTRDGYQAAHANMHPHFENMTIGNAVLGGVIGVVVDANSGAMYYYDKSVQVTLMPVEPAATPAAAAAPADASAPAKPQS
jgi:hypothetical protein